MLYLWIKEINQPRFLFIYSFIFNAVFLWWNLIIKGPHQIIIIVRLSIRWGTLIKLFILNFSAALAFSMNSVHFEYGSLFCVSETSKMHCCINLCLLYIWNAARSMYYSVLLSSVYFCLCSFYFIHCKKVSDFQKTPGLNS